ncbi:type II secretion system protein [Moritella sp. 24]|uniref:type IV pilin protein n=1 Tax=Moritella sp. 24 TaxID=2746230 RepID=UPI001BA6A000|nr:type II secretion system protein [Moritella sp. 24]QUM77504.1 type II secretion system protein [Moritella sp. 24]
MKSQNQSKSAGFTLIELVIVIIVLGVLASVAIPKFINLQRDAKIATLSGIAGQLEDQSKIAHLRAQMDNIPVSKDCFGDCNGHLFWDGSREAGHYFIMTADGTKLYMEWGYPLYTPIENNSVTNINFKSAMGLNDSEFVFVEGYPLKIFPRLWADKLATVELDDYKCYVAYTSATSVDGNDIRIVSDDC